MDRRAFLKLLGAGGAAFLLPSTSLVPSAWGKEKKKPLNFLFILVDDLGWKDLGYCGSTFYETPEIDRFAESAVRFTRAYAAGSVCSPTRAALMTGKYPDRVGITDWIPGNSPKRRPLLGPKIADALALEERTLAERLKSAGYRTFFAGKWHLGGKGFYPENQGFDWNVGGFEKGSPQGGYYVPYKNPKLPDGPPGEYLTDRLTDESIRFLERHGKEAPFLLYLSFYTVHTPVQACKRYAEHFKKKAGALPPMEGPVQLPEGEGFTKTRQDNPSYASMVRAMDANVGRLLAKLEALGLADRTAVIFTSDNGGLSTLYRRGYPTSNLPLRAGKGWLYEGGIRVPLAVRVPGLTRPGAVNDTPVISMDLFATVLDLAGLGTKEGRAEDGMSLVPILAGQAAPPRPALFWHYPHYHGSAWKPGAAVLAGGRWKLIEFYEQPRVELYDLRSDPGERRDLAERMPEKKRELLHLLHTWQKETGARFPRPNPAFEDPAR